MQITNVLSISHSINLPLHFMHSDVAVNDGTDAILIIFLFNSCNLSAVECKVELYFSKR